MRNAQIDNLQGDGGSMMELAGLHFQAEEPLHPQSKQALSCIPTCSPKKNKEAKVKAIFRNSAMALGAVIALTSPSLANTGTSTAITTGETAPVQTKPRPNVLIWIMDDVGFAQLSSFGGLIDTPNIDRVAANGLRYTNYHTAPICSASRAALLTGRNPHSVHMGAHALVARAYPGYDAKVPPEAGTIAAHLKAAGYATLALGKWDHLPTNEMTGAGPFERWPTQQGFDKFYGFVAGDVNNWRPTLIQDTAPVPSPGQKDYHLNEDLANNAISFIHARGARDPKPPFFIYFATGTAHAPHHAPSDWVERYRGTFDMGWDKLRETILKRQIKLGIIPRGTRLAPRPEGMPAWNSLSANQKRLFTRQMEVFAAALSHADAQFGRVLDSLEQAGELDNTITLIVSDNGASAEGGPNGTFNENLYFNGYLASEADNLPYVEKWGGPETFPHYGVGWAVAGNTPFRYYKTSTHEGGIHVPLVFAWPKRIAARGGLRDQFVAVPDLAPTILKLAEVKQAEFLNDTKQTPMEGLSFAYSLTDAKAGSRKGAQYFELFGNKGLWSDGWVIVTSHRTNPWDFSPDGPINESWELYDLSRDPGQTTNLASRYPRRVVALAQMFEQQAQRFQVNPIGDPSDAQAAIAERQNGKFNSRRGLWHYSGPVSHIAEPAAPPTGTPPFRMTAKVEIAQGDETGPIYAQGGDIAGMGLYLKEGVPTFVHKSQFGETVEIWAKQPLPIGATRLELELDRPKAMPLTPVDTVVTIRADGKELVTRTVKLRMSAVSGVADTFDIGTDHGDTVTDEYQSQALFPGRISDVWFDFSHSR